MDIEKRDFELKGAKAFCCEQTVRDSNPALPTLCFYDNKLQSFTLDP